MKKLRKPRNYLLLSSLQFVHVKEQQKKKTTTTATITFSSTCCGLFMDSFFFVSPFHTTAIPFVLDWNEIQYMYTDFGSIIAKRYIYTFDIGSRRYSWWLWMLPNCSKTKRQGPKKEENKSSEPVYKYTSVSILRRCVFVARRHSLVYANNSAQSSSSNSSSRQ